MNWLIVEDALQDRKGHWFEYMQTFRAGLEELGDQVTILASREASPFIREELQAVPVLPPSIWHRMGDGASRLRRFARVPLHALATIHALRRHFRNSPNYDVIFVPTVLVHHLLAWTWLVKRALRGVPSRVLLFFPNVPVRLHPQSGGAEWTPSPTTGLFRRLLRLLGPEVHAGRVVLGAETHVMCETLTMLSGVPFTYFPQPVAPVVPDGAEATQGAELVIGSYGGARHEKGSDILYRAASAFARSHPDCRVRFVFQCLDGFEEERRPLENDPRTTWLARYFQAGEYAGQLGRTHLMLLPYRLSSYRLRGSRVALEAMVNGIPIIATRGSTLAAQAEKFGAVVTCEEDDPASVAGALHQAVRDYTALAKQARRAVPEAREHFSVRHFRECLTHCTVT